MYRASLEQKIDWLHEFCKSKKPKHRDTIKMTVGDTSYDFKPGKLLDNLKPYFVDKQGGAMHPPEELSALSKMKLLSIPWFRDWLDNLCVRRKAASQEISFEHQIQLIVVNYANHAPSKNASIWVERMDGTEFEYLLNPRSVLDKFSLYLFQDDLRYEISPSLKDDFFALPWTMDWYERAAKRRDVARMRNVVSKNMKLAVLLNMYSERKPKWKERVNIVYNTNGDLYPFYPGTFLDDLVGNFYENTDDREVCSNTAERPGVRLDDAQKLALRSIPWFDSWCESIIKNRQLRPLKRALESSDIDTDCEASSDEIDTCVKRVKA